MSRVVVINGSAGVGKDTFCQLCRKYARVAVTSIIDPVKGVARSKGWNGEKTEEARAMLCALKDELQEKSDFPYLETASVISVCLGNGADIVFVHMREAYDIERAVRDFRAATLLITRDIDEIKSNHADANVYEYDYEYTIKNRGTIEQFEEQAKWFVKDVLWEVERCQPQ